MKKKTAKRKLMAMSLRDYKHQPGDRALYSTEQAPGADVIPNGTAVLKCNSQESDGHQDGQPAHVLGSLRVRDTLHYFVEWLDTPGKPVLVEGTKIHRMED